MVSDSISPTKVLPCSLLRGRLASGSFALLLAAFFLVSSLRAESFRQLSADVLANRTSESISPGGRFVAFANERSGIQIIDAVTGHTRVLAKLEGVLRRSTRTAASVSNSPTGGLACPFLCCQLASLPVALPTFSWPADDAYLVVSQDLEFRVFRAHDGHLLDERYGSLAEISPDGSKIAFVKGHNLWMASMTGAGARQLTDTGSGNGLVGEVDATYGGEFDVRRHYWWAPNSQTILYVETEFQSSEHYVLPGTKFPVFRLKKVDLQTGKTALINESSDEWPYLLRVTWHPDSKRVLYYRMNRLQTTAELCVTGSENMRVLEREQDAYWVNAPETPLIVGDGNEVVVSSERTGARHVYLYGLDGELIRDLTANAIEVEHLHRGVDPKGDIFISGSTGNHQELQLFELALNGGAAKQITSGVGWHKVNISRQGNAYLDSYSNTMAPPAMELHKGTGKRRLIIHFSTHQKAVRNEFLEIRTHDNVALPARLYKPDDFDTRKKYPVIFYTYSGPGGRVVKDSWGDWQTAWNREMVNRGYLVLAVDVRGSGGYGHLFEEYIHYRLGAQEVADLREVVSYLQQLRYVDRTRLGIWGSDYGAHTVVHAMLQCPGGFKAGFADSPIVDWRNHDAYFTERYLGLPASHISEYDDSTALADAKRMTGTLMVFSSPGNVLIRAEQAKALQEAMQRVKKNRSVIHRLQLVEEADSNYRDTAAGLQHLMEQMTTFFLNTL
jgi:dipeptidyl-peptidase-4